MRSTEPPSAFSRRVFVAAAIVAGFTLAILLLRQVANVLLVVFAGLLFATFLDRLARFVSRRAPVRRGFAVGLTVFLLLAGTTVFGWLVGPDITRQLGELMERLPEALSEIRERVAAQEWSRPWLGRMLSLEGDEKPGLGEVVARIGGIFSTAAGALGTVLVVFFLGLYVAIDPGLYRRGALLLFPARHRRRAGEVLAAIGHALAWWLVGRFASMAVVGVLTAGGLLAVGMPLAIALGFIAGLASFAPYIGPIASVVPALVIALGQDSTQVLAVLGIYGGVQLLESYVITPLIEQRVVSLPPALVISTQLVAASLAGLLGIFLASPLTVVVVVVIQMVYVEDVLDEEVTKLGEQES